MSKPRRFVVAEGSPAVDEVCPACRVALKLGDAITLVPIGPGESEEEREKARTPGRFYNAVAVVAHYACVTGEP